VPTRLGRALCGLRRSAAAPRQAPGLHLADLALLRFDGHQRQVVDLLSGRLLQREAPGLDCALLVRNQRVDELLIERGGVRNWGCSACGGPGFSSRRHPGALGVGRSAAALLFHRQNREASYAAARDS